MQDVLIARYDNNTRRIIDSEPVLSGRVVSKSDKWLIVDVNGSNKLFHKVSGLALSKLWIITSELESL